MKEKFAMRNQEKPVISCPWWSRVVRKNGSSRLYVKMYYHGRYIEKSTGLKDTEANRIALQETVNVINHDLAADSFVFERAFPGASEEDKAFFAEKEGRTYTAPPDTVTFRHAYKVWEEEVCARIGSENTRSDYQKALKPHILPYFGEKTFDQITKKLVENFFASRFRNDDPAQGLLSKKRMNNIKIPLVKIWEFTVRTRKWHIDSPFQGINDFISRITSEKSISLTIESVKDLALLEELRSHESAAIPRNRRVLLFSDYMRILGCLDPFFCPAAETALLTGLIASEIAGIHQKSRHNGLLHVAWSVRGNKIRNFHKTQNRTRKIPLTNAINRAIDAAIDQNQENSIFVFLGKRGGVFKERAFREAWYAACDKAGIERVAPYALRHCFVAYSELLGIDKQRIIGLMGHADKDMIDRVYGKYVTFLEKDRQDIKDYFGEDYWGE